jgi:hypothetical protein
VKVLVSVLCQDLVKGAKGKGEGDAKGSGKGDGEDTGIE